MNIAVNTRLLLKNKLEGIGWFSYETLKIITQKNSNHTFYFIFDRPYHKDFIFAQNVIPIVVGPPTRHPILWWWWFEITIPKILKKINADIFVSPDGYLSLTTKVPSISVIHDINFVHNPKQLPFLVSKYYNYYFNKFAKKAHRIGTVSEYSKNDISKTFNICPNKIDVFYNGSNTIYSPVDQEVKSEVKQKYSQGEDFFIFIGAINPRKNIPGLLKSFQIFKQKTNYKHKLIIVGDAMHLTGEVDRVFNSLSFKKDVLFIGRQPVTELHKLLGSATSLVFIPFFEGFGIPLVEAMYCDTPIICSNKTSLPEVVGEAALMSEPTEYDKIASNMQRLVEDENLKTDIIQKARSQRERFSWDKSAERFWKCIEQVIKTI
jgi:glycosyltransferase involved in cell wall biosynthesis